MCKVYIEFKKLKQKPNRKTREWVVEAISSGSVHNKLGIITWRGAWWQYVFEPEQDTVWSHGCLKQIEDFLIKINKEERKKWRTT